MDLLTHLTGEARKYFDSSSKDLRVDNIIIGKTLYTIKGSDTVFTDMNFCLVLLENAYGFSYFQSDIDYSLSKFVNCIPSEILTQEIPIYLRVAILDALFCLINKNVLEIKSIFKGGLREKATQRAVKLLESVSKNAKVLLLGAATEIIEEARGKGCELKVLDLEKQKIGLKLHSINIQNGEQIDIEYEIRNTDYVIATGMIFVSGSADRIFELVRKYNKQLILFMETGSNFGSQLIKYGASIVLSEFFPYYDFYGDTKYLIFKNNQDSQPS